MLIFMTLIELTRQELGTRGNKTGQIIPMLWSLGLTVPVMVAYCYFLRLQSYVLYLDIWLNSLGLGFASLGFLLGLISILSSLLGGGGASAMNSCMNINMNMISANMNMNMNMNTESFSFRNPLQSIPNMNRRRDDGADNPVSSVVGG